jgi:hypothetical protein
MRARMRNCIDRRSLSDWILAGLADINRKIVNLTMTGWRQLEMYPDSATRRSDEILLQKILCYFRTE